jgi:hypothetical protein
MPTALWIIASVFGATVLYLALLLGGAFRKKYQVHKRTLH